MTDTTTKDWPADPPADADDGDWSKFYDRAVELWSKNTQDAVYSLMRDALATEQKPVQYSQEVHDAILLAMSAGLASAKGLIAIGGAKRRQLEQRVAALEARSEKTISDHGVWKSNVEYPPGAAVTHGGGLWISKIQTKACRPGDNAMWRLAVKRGSAG
jgi:hypothetical protein